MKPQFISNENIVAFDCDDTLILWDHPKSDKILGSSRYKIHEKHVQLLKRFHARGQFVIVWSKGGAEWAKKVVDLLGIEDYVNLIISKPSWLFDDRPLKDLGYLCFEKDEDSP